MPQVPREWSAVGAFGRPTERAARARSGGIPFRFNPVSAGRAGRSGTPVFCGRGVASARLRPSCGPVAQLDVTPIGPGYAPCCRIVPDTPPQPAVTEQPGRRRWTARVLAVLAVLGPGLITANADNDAGGILTYGEGQPAARARRVRAAFPLRRRQALLRHRAHRRWSNRPQPTRGGVERTRRRVRSAASARTSVGRFCACWKSSKKASPRPPPSCGSDPNPPAKVPAGREWAAQRQAPVTRWATNAAFDVLRDSTLRGEISLAVGIRHRVESGVLIDSPTRSIQTIMLVCRIMLWRNHFTPSMESLMIRPACHSLPQQPSRPLGYRGLSSLPRVISTVL